MNFGNSYEQILGKMTERYQALTGFWPNDASDIGIRLKVLAEQIAALCAKAEQLRGQVFPQTSTGLYLERHAETRGLQRKPGIPATGVLRFWRELPAQADISIPAGVICATRGEPFVRFETVEAGVLSAGETELTLPCRAMETGQEGNVAARSVCLMITTVTGISAVENPAACVGGADGESDEGLKERLLASYQNISNGTNRAFYYDMASSHPGVLAAQVLPRARGRGTVDVVIACAAGLSGQEEAAVVAQLQEELGRKKEINVDVLVRLAVTVAQNIAVEIDPEEGYSQPVLAEQAEACVREYLAGFAVGQPLYIARLGAKILAVDGVKNYRFAEGLADVTPAADKVLRPGVIAISRLVTT